MHKIFPEHSTQKVQQLNDQLSRLSGRTAVGFCVRYWDKPAYVNRKRYELILKVAKVITACEIPSSYWVLDGKIVNTDLKINL